ncbi:MAG TPA: hypothetical protein VF544_16425 [Pyrinomonadaceae bacterium]
MSPETYSDVFERLERDQARYVVVGGVAVVLHGYVRPIADLDLVIDRAPEEINRAMRALSGLGFVPSIPLPLSALTVLRMFDQHEREIDVFVRYAIPFEELRRDSAQVHIGRSTVRIISREHLLRVKRINGRAHDLMDVEALLALEAGDSSHAAPPPAGQQDKSG